MCEPKHRVVQQSYATQRQSSDRALLLVGFWQLLRLFPSCVLRHQKVLDEVARGDAEIATRRLEILRDFPLLEVREAVQNLAAQFVTKSNLPPKAADDTLH